MPDQFASVIVVDWSAASKVTSETKRDNAIWVGCCSRDTHFEMHFRTRTEAEYYIHSCVVAAVRDDRRVLVGFDFAMGYPVGFATKLTGSSSAASVWHWLAQQIEDSPNNQNNRFAVASKVNRLFNGPGPFWSHPHGQIHADLPTRKAGLDYDLLGVAEFRAVEKEAPGAKPVWMLFNPGAVGSQSLLGLPMIHRLSLIAGVSIWPFQATTTPVVLAEVYPSLLSSAVNQALLSAETDDQGKGIVKDQVQVRILARALFALSLANKLAPLFDTPAGPAQTEEGWILGARHVAALEGAVR